MNALDVENLERRLLRHVQRCSKQFGILEPDDHIMVCLSGGKDSWVMLHLLRLLQDTVPFDIQLTAVNLDQGHPGFPSNTIPDYLDAHGYTHHMVAQDTYTVVQDKTPVGKTTCYLCSRMRRGILYKTASELGCNKLALGHHRDDILQTVLLNMFFAGKLATMAPKVWAHDDRGIVIRPLALCAEEDIAAYAQALEFPIIPCNLCGSQENLQRQKMKDLINDMSAENPRIKGNMMAALGNFEPAHMLDLGLREKLGFPTT